MTRWWREPYPSLVSPWKVVVVPAAIIFLVLYLLQPFGIARIESGKLWVTLGAACISAGVSSVFVWVLPRMFPKYYEERAWTLGKEVDVGQGGVGHVGLVPVHHRVRLALRGVALRGDAGCASFLHGAALGADIGGFPHRALRDVEPQYPVGKEPARGHGAESSLVPKAGSG